jgi:hypothetical protein
MQNSLGNFKAEFFKALSQPARIKILELIIRIVACLPPAL